MWWVVAGALLAAWRPVEVYPSTAVILTTFFLGLIPWVWKRSDPGRMRKVAVILLAGSFFIAAGQAGGWDRSQAILESFLVFSILTTIWLASRERPSDRMIVLLGMGVAALAVWGLRQSFGGLEDLRSAAAALPPSMQPGAVARIDQARAFASLLLPSHLGVLLATVMPILMVRIRRTPGGFLYGSAFLLAAAGVLATQSPVSILLATAACLTIPLVRARRTVVFKVLFIGAVGFAVVIGFRPDVHRLEPVHLRLDNWGAALRVWATAPVTGAGLGAFGAAAESLPRPVGNHPVHAHSLPFELFADLGFFGLAGWIIFMVWLLRLSRVLLRGRPALAAAILVIPLHNFVDFSLYTTGVALPWAVLAGWAVAMVRSVPGEASASEVSRKWRFVPVALGSVAVALSLLGWAGAALEEAAQNGVGSPIERMALARRAVFVAPWRPGPPVLFGVLALERPGYPEAADALEMLESFHWQRPRSAVRARLISRLKRASGDPMGSIVAAWEAAMYRPWDRLLERDYENLVQTVETARHDRP